MDITIDAVNNGWLVICKSLKTANVFTDRESMMAHINDIVPATMGQDNFVDNLDDNEADCDYEYADITDIIRVLH